MLSARPTLRNKQAGGFILEAIVSMLLVVVGVVALMGVAAMGINQVGQSKYRNDASNLASELVGYLWTTSTDVAGATPPNTVSRTTWDARVAATLPGGDSSLTTVAADGRADIKIKWTDVKTGVVHQYDTTAYIVK